MRLVGPNGEQVGIVAINDALRLAQEADLDLVEVAPTARPPVAKLMDYGKFKYESALKARESRKHQAQTVIKEIKLRPKIDPHDYGTKKGHVERFLGDRPAQEEGRGQGRPDAATRFPRVGPPGSAGAAAARGQAGRAQSGRVQSGRVQSGRVQSGRVQSGRAQSGRAEASRAEASRAEASRAEASRAEASRAEASRAEASRAEASRAQARAGRGGRRAR